MRNTRLRFGLGRSDGLVLSWASGWPRGVGFPMGRRGTDFSADSFEGGSDGAAELGAYFTVSTEIVGALVDVSVLR